MRVTYSPTLDQKNPSNPQSSTFPISGALCDVSQPQSEVNGHCTATVVPGGVFSAVEYEEEDM